MITFILLLLFLTAAFGFDADVFFARVHGLTDWVKSKFEKGHPDA